MKKLSLLLLVIPAFAFADAPTEVPALLKFLMDMLFAVPGVGPIALEIIKYVAVIGGIMTALAAALKAIAASLKIIGQFAGLDAFVLKVEELYNKVWPYIAWLSLYNVQKK